MAAPLWCGVPYEEVQKAREALSYQIPSSCSSSSDYKDIEHGVIEDSISEPKSDLTYISGGCFPDERDFSYEDLTFRGDRPSVGSSIPIPAPVQGTCWSESRGPTGRGDRIEDDPEQICKPKHDWDVDVGSDPEDLVAANVDKILMEVLEKLRTQQTQRRLDRLMQELKEFLGNQKHNNDHDSVSPEPTQEKDSQLSSRSPPPVAQDSHQDHDAGQDLPKCRLPENKEVRKVPKKPPRLNKDKRTEMMSQVQGSRRTGMTAMSSMCREHAEEEDTPSNAQTTSCLAFKWLRKQLFSALRRRSRPEEATKRPGTRPQGGGVLLEEREPSLKTP